MDVTDDRTEQLVRQTLNAVANQVRSPEAENDEVQADERSVSSRGTVTALRRNHRRKRRLVVFAACLVVLLVAGGFALLTQRAQKSPNVSVSPAAVQPPDTDTSLPYAIPASVDEITSLVPLPTLFEQTYSGTYAGGSAQITVSIEVFPDVLKQSVGGTCIGPMPKVEVHGHEGCAFGVADSQGTIMKQIVSWVQDSNTSMGVESPTLSRDQLVELANSVQRDATRAWLDPIPDGLQPSGTHSVPNADEQGVVYVNFTHNGCDYLLARQVSTTLPTGSSVTINGYPGILTAENTLAWVVRGSLITLNVGSINNGGQPVEPQPVGQQPVAASCDVQATAATIRYITEADWTELVSRHNPSTGSTTSTPSTTATTTPPTTAASPASDSSQPQYEGDEAQIADVFRTFISGPDIDTLVSLLEDGEALRGILTEEPANKDPHGGYTARVDSVTLVDDTHAQVSYSIVSNGSVVLPNQRGGAVKLDGSWKMSRAGYCALVAQGGIQCPPA